MKSRDDLSIVFSGEAGQGIQTLEKFLVGLLNLSGYNVFSYSEFMSRIRGGNNSTQLRICPHKIGSPTSRIDIFVPMKQGAFDRFHERISPETVILTDKTFVESRYLGGDYPVVEVPLLEMAAKTGNPTSMNMLILGLLAGFLYVEEGMMEAHTRRFFKGSPLLENNVSAALEGYKTGTHLLKPGQVEPSIQKTEYAKGDIILSGVDAIGLGALAGGCDFVSSYPMSPSTGVLVFMANRAKEFEIVVEQAEDEIAAVNMAMGSWYAGGRAMVTTSGGGFALMTEGLSLAGCIESPLVIHVGQRPGPATGLPTRTEQSDLDHALHAGHGEFPRVIFAPGSVDEGFSLTSRAFYIADKYQVPVIILTDQFYLDSLQNIRNLDMTGVDTSKFVTETRGDYKRYALVDGGISPRGIPGLGKGLVCIDSDEHDEWGQITEDPTVRTAMVKKRLGKLEKMQSDILRPSFAGNDDFKYLFVGWGSTLNVLVESLETVQRDDIAILHFAQVYPLHESAAALLSRAQRLFCVENNATAQFARLITRHTGVRFDDYILKYDGMPFTVEDLVEKMKTLA